MTQLNQRRVFSAAVLSSCLLPALAGAQAVLPLELGLLPNISARILLNQYQPMREHLARVLQRPVHLSTAFDWAVFHVEPGFGLHWSRCSTAGWRRTNMTWS